MIRDEWDVGGRMVDFMTFSLLFSHHHVGAYVNAVLPFDALAGANVGGTQAVLELAGVQISECMARLPTIR